MTSYEPARLLRALGGAFRIVALPGNDTWPPCDGAWSVESDLVKRARTEGLVALLERA